LVRRCLDRNVKTRLRDIGEARIALASPAAIEPTPAAAAPSRSRLSWVFTGVAIVALAAVSILHFREQPPVRQPIRYTIAAPENSRLTSFALSPNGRYLAIGVTVNGKRQLWLRALDTFQLQPLANTEGGAFPFWSPDSSNIAFFSQTALK